MTKSQDIPGLIAEVASAVHELSGRFPLDPALSRLEVAADALSAAPKSGGAVTGLVKLHVDDLQIGPEPTVEWEDPRVQAVYEILCDDKRSPNREEHWEGYQARLIVDALASNPLPAAREEVGGRRSASHAQKALRMQVAGVSNDHPNAALISDLEASWRALYREDHAEGTRSIIVKVIAALRRAPAAPSQEAVARLILSVSSVSYDEANNERREMARAAAEKVIAALASPQGQESGVTKP